MKTLAAFSLAALSLAASLLAQQTTPAPPPQFRAQIDVVRVDVSVLDARDQPVHGLTAEDFVVLEDGRPQQIAALTEVNLPVPEEVTTPWMRDVPFDVRSNADLDDRRLVVILMDDSGNPNPQVDKSVKSIARSTIARLGPKDLACIVFPQGERDAADFTSDRARLLAAVERYRPRAGGAQMWNVIRDVSAALAAAPQRRKAIILIAKAFPLDLFTTPGNALAAARGGGVTAAWEDAIANSSRAAEILGTAHSSMINIYPIDPNGLEAPSAADIRSGTAFPGQERRDAAMMLADLTGGRAVVNTNDFEPGLTQIFRENSSYYLLGYTPENRRSDGKYRAARGEGEA